MKRFAILFLLFWLPLQSFAAVTSEHGLITGTIGSNLHTDCDDNKNVGMAAVNDLNNAESSPTESHCASCHLNFIKMMASTSLAADFSSSHRFHNVITSAPASVVSAVPEPIPVVATR